MKLLALLTLMALIGCSVEQGPSVQKPLIKTLKIETDSGFLYGTGYHQSESRERVIVLDDGIYQEFLSSPYMCKDVALLSFQFGTSQAGAHGTNLISIISEGLDTDKYCVTAFRLNTDKDVLLNTVQSLKAAIKVPKTKIINMSIQSFGYKHEQYKVIKQAIEEKQIYFNVAAGNYRLNLDTACVIYPACYAKLLERESNMRDTGLWNPANLRKYFKVIGVMAPYSNHGSVIDVFMKGGLMGTPPMQGTSMATALYTNLMVRKQ